MQNGYKNCGIIDTLEQQLYISQDGVCSLCEAGIVEENNNDCKNNANYMCDETSRIYFNSDTFYEGNKKNRKNSF